MEAMTVKQLIDILSQFPDNTNVYWYDYDKDIFHPMIGVDKQGDSPIIDFDLIEDVKL